MIRKNFVLGLILALPLAAFGASRHVSLETGSNDPSYPADAADAADAAVALPADCDEAAVASDARTTDDHHYKCCWVFWGGMWWCIPCS